MRVESSAVLWKSSRSYLERHEKTQELRAWVDGGLEQAGAQRESGASPRQDRFSPTGAARGGCAGGRCEQAGGRAGGAGGNMLLTKLVVEALTGRKMVLLDASELTATDAPELDAAALENARSRQVRDPEREGWGVRYAERESHEEREDAVVEADGVIRTRDGADIRFSVALRMSRSFMTSANIDLRAGDAKRIDPLVINFGGTAAELTDTRFAFDLDADGKKEQISGVKPGSGILVFDRNGNGKVDDGRELFGPASGNAFEELAEYDEDGNGWIDGDDGVYRRLSVWTRAADGTDALKGLGERGIQAISLEPVEAQFDLRDGANRPHGQVRKVGVYVGADHAVKTTQQVDLAV